MALKNILKNKDWVLMVSVFVLLVAGLITMKSFIQTGGAESLGEDYFFNRQIVWIVFSFFAFMVISRIDAGIFKSSAVLLVLYFVGILLLSYLIFFTHPIRGSASWIELGPLSFEPAEPMKIVLILMLAKYFSRRHVEIANVKHIFISGIYAAVPAGLIFLQPDLGSAMVFGAIWFGIIMVSGISKKHLLSLAGLFLFIVAIGWFFVLAPYQKERINAFLNPYLDPQGAGYQILQTKIATGSGGLWGRGIGYGSQSRLEFLPENETDFIFAAFSEEWGFFGSIFLFLFFGVAVWRILKVGTRNSGNFQTLFAVGFASLIMAQFFIHIGMNMGILPITGLSLPFVSYGGSHILSLFAGLGILSAISAPSGGGRPDEDKYLSF